MYNKYAINTLFMINNKLKRNILPFLTMEVHWDQPDYHGCSLSRSALYCNDSIGCLTEPFQTYMAAPSTALELDAPSIASVNSRMPGKIPQEIETQKPVF